MIGKGGAFEEQVTWEKNKQGTKEELGVNGLGKEPTITGTEKGILDENQMGLILEKGRLLKLGTIGPETNQEEPAQKKEEIATHGEDGAEVFRLEALASDTRTQKVTERNLRYLIEDQQQRCAITNTPLTPEVAGLDHIIPLSAGGSNTMDNVQVLHREVNRMKGSLSMDEFLDWCRLIANFRP